MSLYAIVGTVFVSIISSILTFVAYFFVPHLFTMSALVCAGSIVFGTVYMIVSYLWVLASVSYLK